MKKLQVLLYRQSTDTFQRGIYFVYNSDMQLVATKEGEQAAIGFVNDDAIRQINDAVAEIFPGIVIPDDFIRPRLYEKTLFGIIEEYFSEYLVDISTLAPAEGQMDSFSVEVAKLCRPYFALSEAAYQSLYALNVDFFTTPSGAKLTFGSASVEGGNTEYALMPYRSDNDQSYFLKRKN